jgi:hypothetical protein
LWVKHPAFVLAGNEPEDWMDEDVVQLPLLQIGPSRWALLYAPDVYEGDGEGGPEAFFVSTQIIELAAEGPKQVWKVEAPPCIAAALDPNAPETCQIATKPREGADAYDLEVRIKIRKKPKTTTYQYVDGAHEPVK